MAEEYDSDAFAIRVSQRLFHVLAGRAVEPGPIEARSGREAALIESVRMESRRDKMKLLRTIKEEALTAAHQREQNAVSSLFDRCAQLDDELRNVNMACLSAGTHSGKPCETFRNAVTACYKEHGSDGILCCSAKVEAFSECAKQLCHVAPK